jgi:glutathione peroxidase
MKKLFLLAAVALMMATSCNNQNNKTNQVAAEPEPVIEQTSGLYDITVKDIDGSDVSLANYKGKVLLIVNVASKCGLTPQYEGLEALYQKYKDQGLEILGFPCNQFLEQEPGTNEEIQSFCSLNYNVTFPLFDKIEVNGEAESPLYTYLKEQAPFKGYPEGTEEFATMLDEIHQKTGTGFDQGDAIRWNFSKFLVSKDGKTILRYEPMVTPDMLEEAIQEFLKVNE